MFSRLFLEVYTLQVWAISEISLVDTVGDCYVDFVCSILAAPVGNALYNGQIFMVRSYFRQLVEIKGLATDIFSEFC